MLYFFYGQDSYRIGQKLKEVEQRYREVQKDSLTNVEKFDAQETPFQKFWDIFCQKPMFAKKRLFFLANIFSSEEFKKFLARRIGDLGDSSDVLVLHNEGEISVKDKLFLALKEGARCQEFSFLTGAKLKSWVIKESGRINTAISNLAMERLLAWSGDDMWQLSNDIKKLAAYSWPRCLIEVEDVEALAHPKIVNEIFITIDFLARRDRRSALKRVDRHLQSGDDALYLLSMIIFQFRNLLTIKSEQGEDIPRDSFGFSQGLAKKFGLHPFVAKKSLELSFRFSLTELKAIYQRIFETDLAIKTGKLTAADGLRALVLAV